MNLIVEKAKPEDAEKIIEFLKIVGSESDNLLFGKEGLPVTVSQEIEIIEDINSSERNAMFAAKMDDEVVGICQINCFGRNRISHRSEIALSVKKAYWGKGVGSKMMETLIGFAKNTAKAEILSLEVKSDNERAIALYQKFGFKKFGTYKKFFKINGNYYDADYMNLYL